MAPSAPHFEKFGVAAEAEYLQVDETAMHNEAVLEDSGIYLPLFGDVSFYFHSFKH